jgi:hypothetical protein
VIVDRMARAWGIVEAKQSRITFGFLVRFSAFAMPLLRNIASDAPSNDGLAEHTA